MYDRGLSNTKKVIYDYSNKYITYISSMQIATFIIHIHTFNLSMGSLNDKKYNKLELKTSK